MKQAYTKYHHYLTKISTRKEGFEFRTTKSEDKSTSLLEPRILT